MQRLHETCTVSGCGKRHKAAGFCASHYARHKRGVETAVVLRTRDRTPHEHCSEHGCLEPVKARGVCKMHYARLLRHGFTKNRDRQKPRKPCSFPGCDSHAYTRGLCNQHYLRERMLKSKFDLSPEQLAAMMEKQNGLCAICGKPPRTRHGLTGKVISISADHSHVTGAVRGLLCDQCNRGLGLFQDSPSLLRAAAAYLDRHAGLPAPS